MCRSRDQGRGPEEGLGRGRGESCPAAGHSEEPQGPGQRSPAGAPRFGEKCEILENDASAKEAELTKARQSAETARNEAQAALQEIQEAKKIMTGKAFKMQSKYAERQHLLLTRVRSSPRAFADLPHSVSDTAEFYRAEGGGSMEKLFWSQYATPEHPVSFTD